MAVNEKRAWLVAYDIRDPKRLQQVHAYMVKRGLAVQYSVFVGEWSERELARVLEGLRGQISARRDDVRAYPLPQWGSPEARGPALFASGVHMLGEQFKIVEELCKPEGVGEKGGQVSSATANRM